MHRFRPFTKRFFSTTSQTQLENVGPIASKLQSRAVARLRGPDTVKFLQGLVTNDVVRAFGDAKSSLPTPNAPYVSTRPMYAAMLTAQGRFLYDMFLYKPPPEDEKLDESGSGPGLGSNEVVLLADVDCDVVDEFLDSLKKYRLRSKVDIENVAKDFSCWQRYGGGVTEESSDEEPEAASVGWGGSVDRSGMSASRGNEVGWQWFKDPRLQCLGFRGIFPSNTIREFCNSLHSLFKAPLVEADKETDERNYLLWRLEKGVAEGSSEMPKGEAIPLEYNLAGLNAISFDKGCYVGQELIARSHHRGIIRKRLLPLKFVDGSGKEVEQKVAPKSEVTVSASGKKAGIVTTAIGSRGLGLLRLDEAFKGSRCLSIQGHEDVKVEAVRPEWWPRDWFLEHGQNSAAA